jgi:ribulose 1,5-bisphosphate synthetase/thiazole synthase
MAGSELQQNGREAELAIVGGGPAGLSAAILLGAVYVG